MRKCSWTPGTSSTAATAGRSSTRSRSSAWPTCSSTIIRRSRAPTSRRCRGRSARCPRELPHPRRRARRAPARPRSSPRA
ncbi:MAG: hypothetical protein E4H11_03125 [Myxococcales bacterium]|nr:MAG: hypothetical protein E4H11_03125 [Myxococcales bacterium]